MLISIDEFYKDNKVPKYFDELLYLKNNPNSEFFLNSECKEKNIDEKHRLYFHFCIFGKNDFLKNNKFIFLKVNNGLANRLRTLNSFWAFAKRNNFNKLKVCWEAGPGWSDERFEYLFNTDCLDGFVEFISKEDYDQIELDFHLDKKVIKKDIGSHEYVYLDDKDYIIKKIKEESFCYDGDSCLEFMLNEPKDNSFYNLLQIKDDLIFLSDMIYDKFVDKKVVGIHIRRGDSKSHPNRHLYEVSDDESFEKNINRLLEEDPNYKFFLATDCFKTQEYFFNKYPNNIFFNNNKTFVESKHYLSAKKNQRDALIDLILLSKTKFILGTNNSSFSSVASQIGNIQLEIVNNNKEIKQFKNVVVCDYVRDWQYPCYTEKQAYLNHANKKFISPDKVYFAFPWASLVDDIIARYGPDYDNWKLDQYINYFDVDLDPNMENHTVCQHIHWKGLLPLWNKINVNNIHSSHLRESDKSKIEKIYPNLNLRPWHLLATNAENLFLNKGLFIQKPECKKYLLSFIGAHNQYYPNNLRVDLHDTLKSKNIDDVFLDLKKEWFYNKIVYDYQIKNKSFDLDELKDNSFFYNNVLSNSVFNLCPEGTGPNTLRIWEGMSVGSIPVLFANDWIKPLLGDYMWRDFSIILKVKDIPDIYEILKSEYNDIQKINDMSLNCINAYNYSRKKTCF